MSAREQIQSQTPGQASPRISCAAHTPRAGDNCGLPSSPTDQRLLLIRLGGFGDVVFTLPAVHLLRCAFPKAHITFLVYEELASLLEGFTGVDAVINLNRARFRTFNPFTICTETGSLLRQLTRNRFTLTVDFQGFGETGILSWLTRAPQRWGSVYRPGRGWAYTQAISRNFQLHPIDYHLDLVHRAGSLSSEQVHNQFVPPEHALGDARQFFASHNLESGRPTLFIQPFTSSQPKTWPLENFIAIARQWHEHGLQVVFGGGPGEQQALEPARSAGFAVAAGASPLVSASLVKLSTLVLGGDTGLLHLAVAMGKRVLIIMRSVQPGACFPFRHREWALVPSSPALPVSSVSIETVNRACAQALEELGLAPS